MGKGFLTAYMPAVSPRKKNYPKAGIRAGDSGSPDSQNTENSSDDCFLVSLTRASVQTQRGRVITHKECPGHGSQSSLQNPG